MQPGRRNQPWPGRRRAVRAADCRTRWYSLPIPHPQLFRVGIVPRLTWVGGTLVVACYSLWLRDRCRDPRPSFTSRCTKPSSELSNSSRISRPENGEAEAGPPARDPSHYSAFTRRRRVRCFLIELLLSQLRLDLRRNCFQLGMLASTGASCHWRGGLIVRPCPTLRSVSRRRHHADRSRRNAGSYN